MDPKNTLIDLNQKQNSMTHSSIYTSASSVDRLHTSKKSGSNFKRNL